jgi:thiol-disulfide isomerase/thioredoxin
MINKLIGNIFVIYMHIKKYSKRFFLIVTYLLISTNSFALDQIKSGVKMLDLSSVPDTVVFFDDKGEKYSLDNFEGKTILLVFWATWCASCIKEMPDLDVLQKDFRKLPFAIIPVSQDYQGIEIIQKYYKDYDIRYLPIYHDFKNQLFKAFSIVGLPTAILINPDGKMLVSFVGTINWYDEEIRNIILSNIPGNHPEPKNSYREQTLNQPVNKQLKPEEQENKDEKPKIQQNNEENNVSNNASKNDNKE